MEREGESYSCSFAITDILNICRNYSLPENLLGFVNFFVNFLQQDDYSCHLDAILSWQLFFFRRAKKFDVCDSQGY